MFEYEIVEAEGVTKVLFKGDMDIEISELMEEEITPALQRYEKIEINFADVQFVDSTGIGLLLTLVNELKEQEVSVRITELSDQVSQVFELLQIPEILGPEIFTM